MFPKDNFNITKLDNIISYLLEVFNKTKKIITEKRFYNHLKYELFKKLDNWKKFKPIRGKIEDFFKLLKQRLNIKEIQKYTSKSVEKTVYLNVFLGVLKDSSQNSNTTIIRERKKSDPKIISLNY
ncbi:hypothetical protein MBORA_11070 [Methanobrevibacter oralis]|uniref:Uncharacterized protein n=1 Tax=Methanobrevibacter oralis TaxID=66851 RepID=A0A166AY69_METOA|nr:hypothetical protein MBORA_11070 [Methanobrevibacter oralis]